MFCIEISVGYPTSRKGFEAGLKQGFVTVQHNSTTRQQWYDDDEIVDDARGTDGQRYSLHGDHNYNRAGGEPGSLPLGSDHDQHY